MLFTCGQQSKMRRTEQNKCRNNAMQVLLNLRKIKLFFFLFTQCKRKDAIRDAFLTLKKLFSLQKCLEKNAIQNAMRVRLRNKKKCLVKEKQKQKMRCKILCECDSLFKKFKNFFFLKAIGFFPCLKQQGGSDKKCGKKLITHATRCNSNSKRQK